MVESVDDPPVTLGHSKWIVPRTTRVYAPGREVDARHSMLAFGLYFVLLPIRERQAAFDPEQPVTGDWYRRSAFFAIVRWISLLRSCL